MATTRGLILMSLAALFTVTRAAFSCPEKTTSVCDAITGASINTPGKMAFNSPNGVVPTENSVKLAWTEAYDWSGDLRCYYTTNLTPKTEADLTLKAISPGNVKTYTLTGLTANTKYLVIVYRSHGGAGTTTFTDRGSSGSAGGAYEAQATFTTLGGVGVVSSSMATTGRRVSVIAGRGGITLQFNAKGYHQASFALYNLEGKPVFSTSLDLEANATPVLSTADIKAGIYLARVRDGAACLTSQKISIPGT